MDIRTTLDPDTWKSELYTQRHNHPQQKVVYIAGRITGKPEYWEDFAEIAGIEYVKINKNTTISDFKQQLRNNEVYYMLNKALM